MSGSWRSARGMQTSSLFTSVTDWPLPSIICWCLGSSQGEPRVPGASQERGSLAVASGPALVSLASQYCRRGLATSLL